jgi:Protein of unknown function (DUF1203)
MLTQAHGYPGSSPAGRSPVVLHPNASHGLVPPYGAARPVATIWAKRTSSSDFGQRGCVRHTRLEGMHTTTRLLVQAIDPIRLDAVRATGTDGHGNRLRPFAAAGQGEPLRCCLRYAKPGERITLISYAPFDHPSVWTEVGPVYIHAVRCSGYAQTARLPEQLATGPRVLRAYRANDTMNYDHNTVVTDDADLTPIIERLLSELDVATVHVRTLAPQCFLYAVTAA